MTDLPPHQHPDEALSGRTMLAVFAGLVGTVIAVTALVIVLTAGGGADKPFAPAGMHEAVAPLQLSTVSADIAGHYRYAKAHMADYEQIPCWCGCQQFLAHRNLADCFVRSDGKGWEAHAAGCGVCNGEGAIAERMLGEGHTPLDVKNAVDTQFGTTAITAPPAS